MREERKAEKSQGESDGRESERSLLRMRGILIMAVRFIQTGQDRCVDISLIGPTLIFVSLSTSCTQSLVETDIRL
jgi:hypothetical protein